VTYLKAAIYSRKSKLSNKGESIENQIQLCKDYAKNIGIKEDAFAIYEDEGFSGGNTDRPQFQQMLKDAKNKKFDVLVCYRLDRISRNISDFSTLIDELQKLGISFVSIREQFDTTTPMGRAMMYIASVFAQLERETIAERIKDNMLELSKTGRWLGGPPPLGFNMNRTLDGEKEVTYLVPNEEELETVKLLYAKYIEYGSLFQTNKYMINSNITHRSWTISRISSILQNPAYCIFNDTVKEYLERKDITVIGIPDKKSGLICYNKTNGNRKAKDPSEWIYAISKHEGIIDGDSWVKVQKRLGDNYIERNTGKSKYTILTGMLRCAKCGSLMSICTGRKRKDGTRPYYYLCTLKHVSGGTKCDNKNATATHIENEVINELKSFPLDDENMQKWFNNYSSGSIVKSIEGEIDKIKKAITKNETAIQNLVKQLSLLSQDASTYIINEIERLSKENNELKTQLLKQEDTKQISKDYSLNVDFFLNNFKNFQTAIDKAETLDEKRRLISTIVKKINWDGFKKSIDIELLGVDN
jgi:DNA invertase Pin-like site-specific DNA recombinase